MGADATFRDAIYPIALLTGGPLPAPGSSELTFSVFPFNVSITFKPSAGCASPGAQLGVMPARAAAARRSYRTRASQGAVEPGGTVRMRLGCARGERLLYSGSSVGFFTLEPPSPRVVRSLTHRHLRTRSVARTVLSAPATVGDDERVEVRLTAFCAPAPGRGAGEAQATTGACEQWTPCTTVTGPWVTSPKYGDDTYFVSCAGTAKAVGSDANFSAGIEPVGIEIGGGLRPGDVRGFYFGVLPTPDSITYQPVVGCSPPAATVRADAAQVVTRRIVRTRRVRPGEPVRLRLECPRGRRLVHSGSGLAFFTKRPPSRRVVRALRHRHRRGELASRTFVRLPQGVGDDERVELQVSALCAARR